MSRFVLSQNLKAGQVFVHGRGGKQWTALADADTENMRKHPATGGWLIQIEVSYRGTIQRCSLSIPLDKIIRVIER